MIIMLMKMLGFIEVCYPEEIKIFFFQDSQLSIAWRAPTGLPVIFHTSIGLIGMPRFTSTIPSPQCNPT
jgi:hypothetical protein